MGRREWRTWPPAHPPVDGLPPERPAAFIDSGELDVSRKSENQKKAGASSDMKVFYGILIAVAVIGVVAVGYSVGSGALGDAATEPVTLEVTDLGELVRMAEGVTEGDPSAPVTIMEFADFQCPACQGFALRVKPQVKLRYVDTGRAKFVFHDFPLSQHPNAFIAARAARCAQDQDRFWQYHDRLFQDQPAWSSDSSPAGRFVGYAEELGLDADAFEGCLRSDRHAELVTANIHLGQQLGVPGTPAVFVSRGGGMVTRLQSFDLQTIERAVQEALGEAADPGDAGEGS